MPIYGLNTPFGQMAGNLHPRSLQFRLVLMFRTQAGDRNLFRRTVFFDRTPDNFTFDFGELARLSSNRGSVPILGPLVLVPIRFGFVRMIRDFIHSNNIVMDTTAMVMDNSRMIMVVGDGWVHHNGGCGGFYHVGWRRQVVVNADNIIWWWLLLLLVAAHWTLVGGYAL